MIENRGPNLAVEYGAYEARMFCEMLLKCSVVILEVSKVQSTYIDILYIDILYIDISLYRQVFKFQNFSFNILTK